MSYGRSVKCSRASALSPTEGSSNRCIVKRVFIVPEVHYLSRICSTNLSNFAAFFLGYAASIFRLRSSSACLVSPKGHHAGMTDVVTRASRGCRIKRASTNSNVPQCNATLSVLPSSRCRICSILTRTCLSRIFSEAPAAGYLLGHNFKVHQPRFYIA